MILAIDIIMIMIKMDIYCQQGSGTLRQQLLMMHVLHAIVLYCMVLHGIAWFLHGNARYCIVQHGIAWDCMVLHGIARYCIVQHGIKWCCMVLHGIACY